VYTQGFVSKTNPEVSRFSGDTFEKVRIVCVECNKLDFLLDYRLGKKQN